MKITEYEAAWNVTNAIQGMFIVNAAQLIELAMTCILYVVLCGDLLIGAF